MGFGQCTSEHNEKNIDTLVSELLKGPKLTPSSEQDLIRFLSKDEAIKEAAKNQSLESFTKEYEINNVLIKKGSETRVVSFVVKLEVNVGPKANIQYPCWKISSNEEDSIGLIGDGYKKATWENIGNYQSRIWALALELLAFQEGENKSRIILLDPTRVKSDDKPDTILPRLLLTKEDGRIVATYNDMEAEFVQQAKVEKDSNDPNKRYVTLDMVETGTKLRLPITWNIQDNRKWYWDWNLLYGDYSSKSRFEVISNDEFKIYIQVSKRGAEPIKYVSITMMKDSNGYKIKEIKQCDESKNTSESEEIEVSTLPIYDSQILPEEYKVFIKKDNTCVLRNMSTGKEYRINMLNYSKFPVWIPSKQYHIDNYGFDLQKLTRETDGSKLKVLDSNSKEITFDIESKFYLSRTLSEKISTVSEAIRKSRLIDVFSNAAAGFAEAVDVKSYYLQISPSKNT